MGWVDNELTQRKSDPDRGDDFFIRGSLRSKPTEDLDIVLRGFRHKRKDGTVSSTPVLDDRSLRAPVGRDEGAPSVGQLD